jgi:Carboxypeptidase regulatory-like domain
MKEEIEMTSTSRSLAYTLYALAFALTIFLAPISLHAQDTRSKISGQVVDPNKASMPGASVKVTDVNRGTTVTLTTNDDGLFQANYLLSGTYQVVVEMPGFKKYIQDGVLVEISQTRELIVVLEVGGTTETVTVTADAGRLNTGDGNLGQTIDAKRLEELPLVHGDPYTLIGLSAGVTYTGSSKLDRPFEPTHIIGYAFDGTRGNRSDLLIDGAPSTATANANEVIATYVPPSDIVQEFKVQTATFDAQFGNTEGGVTSISIKSGTNAFHGTGYLWLEPGGVSANDFFGKSANPPTGRPFTFSNRPGFSVNGPVRIPKVYDGRDKTFFLFGFEAIRDSRPRFDASALSYVPTADLLNGNFAGLGVTIFDPLSGTFGTGSNGCALNAVCNRTAFAGGVIPANRISPIARSIAATFGPPKKAGLVGNIFDSALTERTKQYDNYTFRVDQNFSESNRFFVRGSWYDRNSAYNDYTASPYSGVNFQFAARQGVFDDVHTFNSTTILNVRYGYNRFIRGQDQEPDARGFDLTTLGFPSSFNNLTAESARRFPRFDFPANTILSNGMSNEFRPVGSHSVSAVLNKSLDAHSVKFGSELRIYREDDNFQSNDQTAQFVFDNTYTRQNSASTAGEVNGLQAYASFLLGYPTTLNIIRRADYSEFSKTWGFFVHDDWRVNNKLSLNLGVRWELETALRERQNKSVSGFDSAFVQPINGTVQSRYAALVDPQLKALLPTINVTGGLLFAGVDTGSGLYKTPKGTFLPRLGAAYQLNSKTVLRGGFGLFAGFLGERRGDVIQAGYTRTTTAILSTAPNGAPLPFSFDTPFANTAILEPTGNSLGRLTNLGQAISFFNQNPKVSKQARMQVGLQREFHGGWIAEAEFVGNWGYDIEIVRNINALPNQYLNGDSSRTAAMVANDTFLRGTVANPFANLVPGTGINNSTIARSQLLRPFPGFTDILTTNNDGKSWYYSGQFSLQKRFSKGYTIQAAYTWSKWLQATEYLNQGDATATKMISDQDSPHRIAFSGMWDLPIGKNRAFLSSNNWFSNALLGGWQIGGTVQLQSGFPVQFGTFNIASGATSGDLFYRGGQVSRPSDQRTTAAWFNTAAFQSFNDWPTFLPTGVTPDTATAAQRTAAQTAAITAATPVNHLRTLPYRFANVRRDYIKNVDLTLKKDIILRETMKFQLRFELLNAFNEPYFLAPPTGATAASFGTIVGPQDNYARRAQVGFKFIF